MMKIVKLFVKAALKCISQQANYVKSYFDIIHREQST